MSRDYGFHNYVLNELFEGIDGITSRQMFGGFGFYKDGVFFALISGGTLYFKVGSSNEADYKRFGSKPFKYKAKDYKEITLSFWELPAEIMENKLELKNWIQKSAGAALISKTTK